MADTNNVSDTKIERLLNPTSVVVVGASRSPQKPGGIILHNLIGRGRQIYGVHPAEKEIDGVPIVQSVHELPRGIDLAVITVSAQNAVEATGECARRGIGFVILVASGFGEGGTEGKALEKRLQDIAREYGTRILGPNSLGVFVPEFSVDTIFVEHAAAALRNGGRVAFITQSGSVGVEAIAVASNTGFGLRAFVGLGNKIDLNELDFLRYFGTDAGTNTLAFYLESIESGREFLIAAREVARRKPILMLKAGRSAAGIAAAGSHTGRLAGPDEIIDGALRQYGVQRVHDDEELCDSAKVLSRLPLPKGNRVAVLTPAGGYGVMCADLIESKRHSPRLEMASFSEQTRKRLIEENVAFASITNPVDLTASADDEAFLRSLDSVLEDENVDIVICIAFFAPPSITDNLINELSKRNEPGGKPLVVFSQYGKHTEEYLHRMYEASVVGFPSLNRTVRAVRSLVTRAQLVRSFEGQT